MIDMMHAQPQRMAPLRLDQGEFSQGAQVPQGWTAPHGQLEMGDPAASSSPQPPAGAHNPEIDVQPQRWAPFQIDEGEVQPSYAETTSQRSTATESSEELGLDQLEDAFTLSDPSNTFMVCAVTCS